MTMTKKTIISVETQEAVKNVAELKENIRYYKDELSKAKIGSDEYTATLTKLEQNQAALRNAMHGTTVSIQELQRAAIGLTSDMKNVDAVTAEATKLTKDEATSYNELVRIMAQMKEAWRSTTSAGDREKLAKSINAVNDRLKDMDETVGVFGRRVGSYLGAVDHLMNGLTAMGKGAASIVPGIKGATTALKTMSATPAIAILGALVTVIQKVAESMKSSEEGMEGLTNAMGIFRGVGDAVKALLQGIGTVVAGVANGFAKLAEKLGLVTERMKENQAIGKEELRLAKLQRETVMKNAEAERDIAELRAKAADRDKYSAKERIAMLEQANALEAGIMERSKKAAEDEYNLIVRKNKQLKSSQQDLKAEAEAYAKMVNAETAYNNAVRQNTSAIATLRKEEARIAKEAAKAVKDAATAKLNAEKEYFEQLLQVVAKGGETEYKIRNTIAKKDRDLAEVNARQKITDAKELARTLALIDKTYQITLAKNRQDYNEQQRKLMLQDLANYRDGFEKETAAYMEANIAFLEESYNTLRQKMDESDADFLARRIAANEALKKARKDYLTWEREQADLKRENDLTVLEGDTLKEKENAVALAEWRLEKIREYGQLEGETKEEFRKRELEAEKNYNDTLAALAEARLKIGQTWASNISGLLGSIASAYEAMADDEEKAAEQTKGIKIAAAVIDTISGAIGAYMSAVSPSSGIPAPYNMILGAIQAATVTATGVANIAKIKSTKVKDGSGASAQTSIPAAVTAPRVEPVIPQTRTLTSASDEERLDRMAGKQRVYILSSDLEANAEQRRAEVAETTF